MVTCKICKQKFRAITHKHLKYKHGMRQEVYLKKFNLSKEDLTGQEVREKMSKSQTGLKMGDENPTRRPEVRKKISESIKYAWEKGDYANRVNGMFGMVGPLSPQYKPSVHSLTHIAEHDYVSFLSNFHPINFCFRCKKEKKKINIHHIDEDHSNFLISNLEPLCVPCHMAYHYRTQKQPYLRIARIFYLASAHYLPEYDGKCKNLHGHEWKLEVTIRKRIDKKSMMVMDFSDLKETVDDFIVSQLDHNLINKFIWKPTAENIVVYIWELLMFYGMLKGIDRIKIWENQNNFCSIDTVGMLSIFTENIENYLLKYRVSG